MLFNVSRNNNHPKTKRKEEPMNIHFKVTYFRVIKDSEKKVKGLHLFFKAEQSLERLTREIVSYFESKRPHIQVIKQTLYIFGLSPSGESALSFPISTEDGAGLEKILRNETLFTKSLGAGKIEIAVVE